MENEEFSFGRFRLDLRGSGLRYDGSTGADPPARALCALAEAKAKS
jgi:hypothetical protein